MKHIPASRKPVSRKRTLARQLLASHLAVAFIGLGMLCIALASTYGLRSRVMLLANEGGPMAQSSLQVLAGVWRSIAELGGWVNLGDERFLRNWQAAWSEQVEPSIAWLVGRQAMLQDPGDSARLKTLAALLADLKESQWWVQDVAHTPGNEPARIAYLFEIEPIAETLDALIAALIHEESGQAGGEDRKALLVQLSEFQRVFSGSRLLLREIISEAGLDYEKRFQDQVNLTKAAAANITMNDRLLTDEQWRLLDLLQRELQAFDRFAQEVIRLRRSANWKVARHRLTTETVPLATQVTGLTTALMAHSMALMEQEVREAKIASALTVWIMVALIITMLIVAYVMSRARAQTLARPIAALSEATQQLAAGHLAEIIPVTRNDELGDLTRAFNTMRTSLYQAQEGLRDANASLEQQVARRTVKLLETNESLRHEIIERKRVEAALREREARVRAIANAVPDVLIMLDEDGRYVDIITSQRHLLYADPNFLKGKLVSEVLPADLATRFLDLVRQTLVTRQTQVVEYELYIGKVGKRWFEARAAPIDSLGAAKPAVIIVARDITQRKVDEEQLRQAQKMEAVGQLTGGVAHDFNNLLAITLGNLELLDEQLAGQPQLRDLVQRALDAAERGATLTQRLLAFSRRQPLQPEPTNLNKLVAGMIDLLRRTLGETIQIETQLATDLGQTIVDPTQLESALLNLALNARDAMPKGGKLVIETANTQFDDAYMAAHHYVRPGHYIMLAVSDTGAGMTPEVLARAFEPFFTTKQVGKGSGLGLSMVYGLVKQSGGHINIYSEVGRGTTVRAYLPQAESTAVLTKVNTPESPLHYGKAEMILVVEDDANVRQLAVSILTSLGYSTVEADNAKAALQLLDKKPQIALLFSDIVLPGNMDGIDLAREARRRWPDLKILLTSGYTEHALVQDDSLMTGVALIAKPYRKASLASKLSAILGSAPVVSKGESPSC